MTGVCLSLQLITETTDRETDKQYPVTILYIPYAEDLAWEMQNIVSESCLSVSVIFVNGNEQKAPLPWRAQRDRRA